MCQVREIREGFEGASGAGGVGAGKEEWGVVMTPKIGGSPPEPSGHREFGPLSLRARGSY